MNIKVLGPGCSNCKKLFKVTKEAIADLNKEIKIEYITDIEQMVSYGIMGSPALVINEKIASQGRLLKKEDVIKLILNEEEFNNIISSCSCGNC